MVQRFFSILLICSFISQFGVAEPDQKREHNVKSTDNLKLKLGFFEDAWNTIKDLFDGDGNVNGTPGDPYTINLGAGSHGGSWSDKSHPFTIFNKHNGSSVEATIDRLKQKVHKGANQGDKYPKLEKFYFSPYKNIYSSAQGSPTKTCGVKNKGTCKNARIAKNAAFVYLMNFNPQGNSLSANDNRAQFGARAMNILNNKDYFNTKIPEAPWSLSSFQWHTKNLVMYLQAYDMLRTADVPIDLLKKARFHLQEYATHINRAATFTNTVFSPIKNNNHTLMTAGALGLASIVIHESAGGFLGKQKDADVWSKRGIKNIKQTLFKGIKHMASRNVNAGYAEGPHYFQYGVENCLPFFLAQYNFSNNPNSHHVDFYNDEDILNLFKWYEGIKMPDGTIPPYDDSPLEQSSATSLIIRHRAALSSFYKNHVPNPNQTGLMDLRADNLVGFHDMNMENFKTPNNYMKYFVNSGNATMQTNINSSQNSQGIHILFENGKARQGAGHEQADLLSYMIKAGDTYLALDPGYLGDGTRKPVKKGRHHNTILVNSNKKGPSKLEQGKIIDFQRSYPPTITVKAEYRNAEIVRSFKEYSQAKRVGKKYKIETTVKSDILNKYFTWSLNGNGNARNNTYVTKNYPNEGRATARWNYNCVHGKGEWAIFAEVNTVGRFYEFNSYTRENLSNDATAHQVVNNKIEDHNLKPVSGSNYWKAGFHTRKTATLPKSSKNTLVTWIKPYKCSTDHVPQLMVRRNDDSSIVLVDTAFDNSYEEIHLNKNGENYTTVNNTFTEVNQSSFGYDGKSATMGMKFQTPSINSKCTINSFYRNASLKEGKLLKYRDTTYISADERISTTVVRSAKYEYEIEVSINETPTQVTYYFPEVPNIPLEVHEDYNYQYDSSQQTISVFIQEEGEHTLHIEPAEMCGYSCFFPPDSIISLFKFNTGTTEYLGDSLEILRPNGHLAIRKGSRMVICPDHTLRNKDSITLRSFLQEFEETGSGQYVATHGQQEGGLISQGSYSFGSGATGVFKKPNRSMIIVDTNGNMVLDSGSYLQVGANSTIIVRQNATLHINNYAEVIVGGRYNPGYGEIIVEDGGNLCVEPNANIRFFESPNDTSEKQIFYVSQDPNNPAKAQINYNIPPDEEANCVNFCNFKNVFPDYGIDNPNYGWMNIGKPLPRFSIPKRVCHGTPIPVVGKETLNETLYKFKICQLEPGSSQCQDNKQDLEVDINWQNGFNHGRLSSFNLRENTDFDFEPGALYKITLVVKNDCGHTDSVSHTLEYDERLNPEIEAPDSICGGINTLQAKAVGEGTIDSLRWTVEPTVSSFIHDKIGEPKENPDTFRVFRDTIFVDSSTGYTIVRDTTYYNFYNANTDTIKIFEHQSNLFDSSKMEVSSEMNFPGYDFKASKKYLVTLTYYGYCQGRKIDSHYVNTYPVRVDAGSNKIVYDSQLNADTSVLLDGTGEGAIGYEWFPTYDLTNPDSLKTIAHPDSTMLYRLLASNNYGCSISDKTTVFFNELAFAGHDTTICAGDVITLGSSQKSGYAYLWSPPYNISDTMASMPNVWPNKSTQYVLNVVDISSFDTVESDSINVYIEEKVDHLIINDSAKVVSTNTKLEVNDLIKNKFNNYQWFRNGDSIPSAKNSTYTPGQAGEYFVQAKWICGNDTQFRRSNKVWVRESCTSSHGPFDINYPTDYNFTNDTVIQNLTIFLNGDIEIEKGVTVELKNSNVIMNSCSKFTVNDGNQGQEGGNLIIDNSKITGCGRWQGIRIIGSPNISARGNNTSHGQIELKSGAEISDAIYGIVSDKGGIVSINNSKLKNNHLHLAFLNYDYALDNQVQNTEFKYLYSGTPDIENLCSKSCNMYHCFPSKLQNTGLNKMIYIDSVKGLDIVNNNFTLPLKNPSLKRKKVAIETYDASNLRLDSNLLYGSFKHGFIIKESSSIEVHYDTFQFKAAQESYLSSQMPENLKTGVKLVSNVNFEVTNSVFNGNLSYGIHANDSKGLTISNSIFKALDSVQGLKNGVYLKDVKNGLIEQNSFIDLEFADVKSNQQKGVGIQLYPGDNYQEATNVTQNTFDNNKFGLVIAPHRYPVVGADYINWGWHMMNVNIVCNDFEDNEIGIVGSGNLKSQNYQEKDPGNKFNENGTNQSANSQYDILWENLDNNKKLVYYYDTNSNYVPNSDSLLAKNSYLINGYKEFSSDHLNIAVGSLINCNGYSNYPFVTTRNKKYVEKKGVKVYPNPFERNLKVKAESELISIEVKNTNGKVIYKENEINTSSLILKKMNNLNAGVYFMKIHTRDRNGKALKMKKIIKIK